MRRSPTTTSSCSSARRATSPSERSSRASSTWRRRDCCPRSTGSSASLAARRTRCPSTRSAATPTTRCASSVRTKPEGELGGLRETLSFASAEPDDYGDLVARRRRGRERDRRATCSDSAPGDPARRASSASIEMLGRVGLNENSRVICEKPFGVDLASARGAQRRRSRPSASKRPRSFASTTSSGKESIDNILALRFANRLFEPIWNRDHVCFVQIDVPETLSIEGRGAFFEETGAFRDMVVSHLFQVLGFVAMEQPTSLRRASRCATRSHKVFESMRPGRPRPTSCAASTTGTGPSRASRPTPRPRPSSRCESRSRTRAGRACPSTCAPASAWPRAAR